MACTDIRAHIYQQCTCDCSSLCQHNIAELCWYFPLTREQYRIKVRIQCITGQQIADTDYMKQAQQKRYNLQYIHCWTGCSVLLCGGSSLQLLTVMFKIICYFCYVHS